MREFLNDFEEFSELRLGLFPRYNVAPSQFIPAIKASADGHPAIETVKWGFIPSWTKGKPQGRPPINAVAETITEKPMWRGAIKHSRALVMADGFYEWHEHEDGTKTPMFIHRKDDDLFAFAAVCSKWTPEEGTEPVETAAIITTPTNALMSKIHKRQPLVIPRNAYARWIDKKIDAKGIEDLLEPWSPDDWEAYEVSKIVNSPKNEVPACSERVG